ncbi:MAG: HAD-IIIA family hydrolase [Saprospiraceae bacterium]
MKKNNSSWSLFLDRDGVINQRIPDDYVKSWDQFIFLPGVLKALQLLKPFFRHIFIVTNQQGVGKGLMSGTELLHIHKNLKKVVRKHGGWIEEIFYCTELSISQPSCRKPAIGMGLAAKKKYPDIDFSQSIIVGDSGSDIAFGKNLGMVTVFIAEHDDKLQADHTCKDLHQFYLTFVSKINN